MGTGGILGKKSWHVGTKQNRQRVLRDEQAANEAASQRRGREELRNKERLYEQLSSTARPRAGVEMQGVQGDGESETRGKAATRTSDPRFDASFRLGGSVGTSAPWYSLDRVDASVADGVSGTGGERKREEKGRERLSLLGAVVVGKVKKISKKERRRAQKEKLMELRAEREHRERIERDRMHAALKM